MLKPQVIFNHFLYAPLQNFTRFLEISGICWISQADLVKQMSAQRTSSGVLLGSEVFQLPFCRAKVNQQLRGTTWGCREMGEKSFLIKICRKNWYSRILTCLKSYFGLLIRLLICEKVLSTTWSSWLIFTCCIKLGCLSTSPQLFFTSL